jgi:hypothetical protein
MSSFDRGADPRVAARLQSGCQASGRAKPICHGPDGREAGSRARPTDQPVRPGPLH